MNTTVESYCSNGEDVNWKYEVIKTDKDTYIPINQIAAGSYSSVWRCYSMDNKNMIALKIFPSIFGQNALQEYEMYMKCEKLNVRNCGKVIELFETRHSKQDENAEELYTCIVMNLLIGSLYDVMSGNSEFKNGFPLDFVIKITKNILESLYDLHLNNIIHGDIKPENILLIGTTNDTINLLEKLNMKNTCDEIIDELQLESRNANINETPNSLLMDDESCEESYDDTQTYENINMIDSSDSEDNYDTVSSICEHTSKKMSIPEQYLIHPVVILADLGSCICDESQKNSIIQTKYYRSPEILLKSSFDHISDMWSLGCTIYELLIGTILFDTDDTKIDKRRYILQQITDMLGEIPHSVINEGKHSDIFFTKQLTLKCIDNEATKKWTDNWIDLLEHTNLNKSTNCETTLNKSTNSETNLNNSTNESTNSSTNNLDYESTIKKYLFVDFLLSLLSVDKKKRPSAKNALTHPIFSLQ